MTQKTIPEHFYDLITEDEAVLVGLSILGTLATWWMPEAEHMANRPAGA